MEVKQIVSSLHSFLRMVPTYKEYFCVVYDYIRGKQILARAIKIQKENWGLFNHAFL